LGIALVHQFACLFADRDGDSWVLVRDASLGERRQKARVGPRVGLRRRGHPEHCGETRKHDKESHNAILVQIGSTVSSNFNARMTITDPADYASCKWARPAIKMPSGRQALVRTTEPLLSRGVF
jgi:hypothetical protein